MKKRILAMVLTLGMLLTMLPVQVFAEDPVQTPSGQVEHHFEPVTGDSVAEQAPQDQEESSVLGEEDSSSQTETTEVTESESLATELPEVIETETTEAEPPKRNTETEVHSHFMSVGDCSAPYGTDEAIAEPMEFTPIGGKLFFLDNKGDTDPKYYYLTEDLHNGTGSHYMYGTVNICLNGHKILSPILMNGNAVLRICDCKGNGGIETSSYNTIQVSTGTRLEFYGGKCSNSASNAKTIDAQGVTLPADVMIADGEISASGNGGIGVYIKGGNLSVKGGSVSGMQSGIYSVYGGYGSPNNSLEITDGSISGQSYGIYLEGFGYYVKDSLLISGGHIQGGDAAVYDSYYREPDAAAPVTIKGGTFEATNPGGKGLHFNTSNITFTLSGSPVIRGMEDANGVRTDIQCPTTEGWIKIDGPLTNPQGELYSVYLPTDETIRLTTGWSQHNGMNPLVPFSSSDKNFGVLLNDGEVVPEGTVGELYYIKGHAHDGVLFEKELTQAEFESKEYSFKDGDSYYLAETMEFAKDLVIEGTVKLCTNGHLMKCYRMCLAPGAKLTLCDCTGDGELLFYFNEEPIIVGADNEFHFYGGTLDIANSEYAILNQGTMSLGWKARLASVQGGVAVKQEGDLPILRDPLCGEQRCKLLAGKGSGDHHSR